MKTIRLLHACLGHQIGDVVEARSQDAVLLISRGWAVSDKPELEQEIEPEVEQSPAPKTAKTMTTANVIKPAPPPPRHIGQKTGKK